MTPNHFYNGGDNGVQYGDAEWLIDQLNQLAKPVREKVSKRYSEIYQELTLSDPNECRKRVNTWMRKTVIKNKNMDIVPF
jgi:hypothetical protein